MVMDNLCKMHILQRVEDNPKKIQKPIKSVLVLGIQGLKTHRDIPV